MKKVSPVYRIELDGTLIQSKEDFFRELRAATGIDHVGNLDALDDDLAGEIPWCCGRYAIIWNHADKSDWSGHSDLTKILGLLAYQQQAFSEFFLDLQLNFDPDPTEDTWSFPLSYELPRYRAERRKRGIGN